MEIDREQIIDQLTEHYYQRLGKLVEDNRIEDSKAVFEEYIVDGIDPNEAIHKYQWMLLPYINGGIE
tara:strand:+ start:2186 stop:2386 length:201 start_codon:yes stop_codon:yes gene_type:complete